MRRPLPPVIEIEQLRKSYGALRPLRIEHLEIHVGESVALVGVDQPVAEVLINLLTGASVPDEGEVRVFGESTHAIPDGDAWLASLDRFGILSVRAVLLDDLTAEQNLAVPFSLELDPIPPGVRADVVALGAEVSLEQDDLSRKVSSLSGLAQARLRLARSIAMGPRILLAEHPNALMPSAALSDFASDFARVVSARGISSLTLTADRSFAAKVASRVVALNPATGTISPVRGWRTWLSR